MHWNWTIQESKSNSQANILLFTTEMLPFLQVGAFFIDTSNDVVQLKF